MVANRTIRLYLDTNVYTDILALPPELGIIREGLKGSGFDVRLSPTNILEFLATPDPQQRERLISLAQDICSPDLLPEVECIVTHYIAEQSGMSALTPFVRRDETGTGQLAAAWRQTKRDPHRTLLTDQNLAVRFRSFRSLFDVIHAHYRRGDTLVQVLDSLPWLEGTDSRSPEAALKEIAARRRQLSPSPAPDTLQFRSREAALLLMMIIVSSGLTPFEEPIEAMWTALAIPRAARLEYTFRNFSFLIEAGPLVGMALAMAAQWRTKSESGNAFDLYHVAYLPLVHLFFTNDRALHSLGAVLTDSEPFTRIRSFRSLLAVAGGLTAR